jgi:hypothetical protein
MSDRIAQQHEFESPSVITSYVHGEQTFKLRPGPGTRPRKPSGGKYWNPAPRHDST